MTAVGGLGHTLPFVIPTFLTAMPAAAAVVLLELASIAWVRHRYMDTPPLAVGLQVLVGGKLVFTALLTGSPEVVLRILHRRRCF